MTSRILISVSLIFTALVGIQCSETTKGSSPILLLAGQQNFGLFTAEILKTEGFNDFKLDSISNPAVTKDLVEKFPVVILAETSVNAAQQDMLSQYVSG